jgi:hypothetical protein
MRVVLNGADIINGQRIVTATVEGRRYEIPELWMIGYCQSHAEADSLNAVIAWHRQARLEQSEPASGDEPDITEDYAGDFALRVEPE